MSSDQPLSSRAYGVSRSSERSHRKLRLETKTAPVCFIVYQAGSKLFRAPTLKGCSLNQQHLEPMLEMQICMPYPDLLNQEL